MNTQNSFEVLLDEDALILDFNEQACELTGYAKNEVMGENWFMTFIPESNITKMIDIFVDTFYGIGSDNRYMSEIILKDGSKKMLNWHDIIIKDKDDKPLHVHSIGVYT